MQWFSAGVGYLLVALALSAFIFGGPALVMYRRDRQRLGDMHKDVDL